MTGISHKNLALAGSTLLLVTVFVAAYWSKPALFFAPALLLSVVIFIQYPRLLFYTLLFSIPWSIEFLVTEGLGTDLPDEPLMLLMAFTTVALFVYKPDWTQLEKPIPLLLLLLLLSFAWSGITVLTSTYPALSIKYLLAKSWYLLAFVGAPLILKGDKKLVQKSAVVLFTSMLLVTCLGLVKHAATGFTFATINEAIAPHFRNHVNYSALLVFMIPLQLSFYKLASTKKQRNWILISIIIVLAALYFSYARGAWMALVAGLFAYWLVRKGWLLRSYLLFLLLLAGLVFWLQQNDRYLSFAPKHDVTIFHEDFTEHLIATYKGRDVSTAERFYRWIAGANMSLEKPLTGFGPTTFYQHYKSYTVPGFRTWVSNNPEQSTVHNYFLLLLIEQGVFGLLFFLALLGCMFWYAQKLYFAATNHFWKTTAAAIAAILWMQVTLNCLSDLIETDKVGSVFYLCLSFLLIAGSKMEAAETLK